MREGIRKSDEIGGLRDIRVRDKRLRLYIEKNVFFIFFKVGFRFTYFFDWLLHELLFRKGFKFHFESDKDLNWSLELQNEGQTL